MAAASPQGWPPLQHVGGASPLRGLAPPEKLTGRQCKRCPGAPQGI